MQKIVPHLWFDKEAKEAAGLYMSLFEGSKLKSSLQLHGTPSGTVDLVTIELAGNEFQLISAGPYFRFTPAISLMIPCNTEEEVEHLWDKLISGGEALMPLGEYPFSKKYGWLSDRYGLFWQLMYIGDQPIKQKITPTLLFVGEQFGRAEEAVQLYTSLFPDSGITNLVRYGAEGAPNEAGTVMHMDFTLAKQEFAAMDSGYDHQFTFSEAISLIVNCETQEEIDYYWDKLSAVPEAEQCGWIKDRYGLSWQIVPSSMNEMMQTEDPEKKEQLTEAFLQMKKLDIEELKKIYER